jgi:hypothetical protein
MRVSIGYSAQGFGKNFANISQAQFLTARAHKLIAPSHESSFYVFPFPKRNEHKCKLLLLKEEGT